MPEPLSDPLSAPPPSARDPSALVSSARGARLARVFRESLDLAESVVVEALRYREVPAWNSVGHMHLVAAIEAEFDIMLETEEIIALDCFARAEEIVAGHEHRPPAP